MEDWDRTGSRRGRAAGVAVVVVGLIALGIQPTRAAGVTYTVPANIVPGCSSTAVDQTLAISAWIAGLPSGAAADAPTTVLFGRDACYRLDLPILVQQKSNLVIDGNGATFKRYRSDLAAVAPHPYSMYHQGYPFWSVGSRVKEEVNRNITFRNMHVVGLNTVSDVTVGFEPEKFGGGWTVGEGPNLMSFQFETGYSFENIVGLKVENLTSDATYGDGLLVGSEYPYSLVENATVDNVTIDRNGRQGITIGTVRNLVIDGARILHSHASGIDIETNVSAGYAVGVEIRNSYINARAVAITAAGLAEASDFYVHDNTIRGSSLSWPWIVTGANPHRTTATPRLKNWRVIGNTDLQERQSAAMWFESTDDVEVRDNVSPLSYHTNPYVVKYPGVQFVDARGTLAVAGNDFSGASIAGAVQAVASAPVSACGNRLMTDAAFDQPVPCPTPVTTTTTTTLPESASGKGLAAPTDMSAVVVSSTQVNTSWTPGTGTAAAASFNVYRNGVLIKSTTNLNYIDAAAPPGTELSYFVRAVDAAGNLGPASGTATVTTPGAALAGVAAPTDVKAVVVSSSQVNLSWAPGASSVVAAGFNVYRDQALLTSTTNVNLIDWAAPPGRDVSYLLRAYDAAGNLSPPSAMVTVTTPPAPAAAPTAPAAPVNLRAVVVSATQVNLAWWPGEGGTPVAGFSVYRNNWLLRRTTNYNLIDATAPKGSTLSYYVRAYDAAGTLSPPSNTVTVSTPGATAGTDGE